MFSTGKIRAVAAVLALSLVATACNAGRLGVFVNAKTPFDQWTANGQYWDAINNSYDSMVVWEPYWDSRLASFDRATVYRDAYAIAVPASRDVTSLPNPEWVLRDAAGNPAYIPWSCANGCPQYAADLGNPDFVASWIAGVQSSVDRGYTGLFIDDVNLLWRFGDEFGGDIAPIDPRTGEVLLLSSWRRYMVEFLEAVRANFPQLEIWHNSIWYADTPDFANGLVNRQIRAADVVHLERGMNDRGLTDGTGRFGIRTFMNFIDRVHEQGANVALLDENATDPKGQWYNIAGGLLTNDGGDLVSTEDWAMIEPTGLFVGYQTDLGAALGPRQFVDGTIQREFTGGLVIMNEPRRSAVTVQLAGSWRTPQGDLVTQVTLGTREAIVLTRP
jgi:hypothetical protein